MLQRCLPAVRPSAFQKSYIAAFPMVVPFRPRSRHFHATRVLGGGKLCLNLDVFEPLGIGSKCKGPGDSQPDAKSPKKKTPTKAERNYINLHHYALAQMRGSQK